MLALHALRCLTAITPTPEKLLYLDSDQPIPKRVADLVSRMTVEEKISQMITDAKAIERLGVHAYNWWNECLHGIGFAGVATVFPQAIGMAATWDEDLFHRIATAISDEARARYYEARSRNIKGGITIPFGTCGYGLTFFTPNINIFRDPRWGRGQETYGEDPYLTSRLGVAFVKGLQGDHPHYFKAIATPKHYAVHSGPEKARHTINAEVTPKDLWETYLPAFEATVREGGAYSVMGAYNRANGECCCASPTLLREILREKWGFEGYVVSDADAVTNIHRTHKLAESYEQACAMALQTGIDLECGRSYEESLGKALEQGLVSEEDLDKALKRIFTARFRTGEFDPPAKDPYSNIPYTVVDCPAHRALALETARKSIVLLKNEGGLLPLSPNNLRAIAVIGPNADDMQVLLGNYSGEPSHAVTIRQGIRTALPDHVPLIYAPGCGIADTEAAPNAEGVIKFWASAADAIIFVGGISQALEGEEGGAGDDRYDLGLPKAQLQILQALHAMGKPVVFVLLNGSPVSVPWAQENIPAILTAWYPGQEGGTAVADVIFGKVSPAGRLPITVVKSADDLPEFTDYAMAGRSYRYSEKKPLYPFGFGLSYTRFEYSGLAITPNDGKIGDTVHISAKVKNIGARASDEVVQLYLTDDEATVATPIRSLRGFKRNHLQPGEVMEVSFQLEAKDYAMVDDSGALIAEAGTSTVALGGCQPGYDALLQGSTNVITGSFRLNGTSKKIER